MITWHFKDVLISSVISLRSWDLSDEFLIAFYFQIILSVLCHFIVRISQRNKQSVLAENIEDFNNKTNQTNDDEQQYPVPSIGLDDVLISVREFGPYQIMLFFLTAPFGFFLAFIGYSQVFITLVPDHWCHIPQLVALGLNQSQRSHN